MGYTNLHDCVHDLEAAGQLRRIDTEIDPRLEMGVIQRRAFQAGGPALLFTRVKGSGFPMLGNLFGTLSRTRFLFRDTLKRVETLVQLKVDPAETLRRPWRLGSLPRALWHTRPMLRRSGPVLANTTTISNLPQLVSWPEDGGGYVTLPQVLSRSPRRADWQHTNLGMYRVQLSGNHFVPDTEVGLHYQIHRGIGPHHTEALEKGESLPVNIFVGGPPAMTLAAVMPLPENLPELFFAGLLGGHRPTLVQSEHHPLPLLAEADFCICGHVPPGALKPEGPFGDHLGYYSLTHDFPVLKVDAVYHRNGAIWPFTTVGRPPQEDTVFGTFIHELTEPLVGSVFQGVHEVHAVDAAGVHPLLLAIGSERYVPFASERQPQELLTNALSLLGSTQTSLSKYLFIGAREDDSRLSTKDIPAFFRHILGRVDWRRDLHLITRTTMDTLDYSGISLNQGSKGIIAAAGPDTNRLDSELPTDVSLPEGFSAPRCFAPGIAVLSAPRHTLPWDTQDPALDQLCRHLEESPADWNGFQLVVVVDASEEAASSWDDFLWQTFTRSDPATDSYGLGAFVQSKHWGCTGALVIDARLKSYHAPPLEPDPEVEKRVDELAAPGGPLHGLF